LKTEVYETVFTGYYGGSDIQREMQIETTKNQYVAGVGAGWSSADHQAAPRSSTMGPDAKRLSRQAKVISRSGTN
jgi:hypothetical protein